MIAVLRRIRDLIRPSETAGTASPDQGSADPVKALTLDLAISAVGFALFGACIAARGDLLWHLLAGAKLSGAFLAAFLLSIAPLYALKRFFEVKPPFGDLVSSFARHLALGGIFAASAAGCFALLRRGDPSFDGMLAIGFVAAILVAVVSMRRRLTSAGLHPFPRALSVILFLSLLGQSVWAFRPYMDPSGPTLFEAQAEWFGGTERKLLEHTIERMGARP